MSDDNILKTVSTVTPIPEPNVPRCPACRQELLGFSSRIITMKDMAMAMTWCPNAECKVLLALQIIGPAGMPEPSRIVPASGPLPPRRPQ